MTITMRGLSRIMAIVSTAFLLTACVTKPPVQIFYTRINADIIATEDMNPDINGRPSPLVVRIYELKDTEAFEQTDFFTLYDDEATTLEGHLIVREEIELTPGEQRELRRKLNEETKYLGIVAAYRDIDQARWRAFEPINNKKVNALTIELGRHNVTINRR